MNNTHDFLPHANFHELILFCTKLNIYAFDQKFIHQNSLDFYLDEPKPEESEDTDAVHRRFLKEPSAKVKDGVSNSEQLA